MFSLPSAPAKQSVSETISVLSGRLNSATLLEDRRAAILGLRSFAKDYPASVASGALRSLIGSLSKDGEDVDTVKVVLETLLMLFSPNEDSPEASDEIALWLADEFTQRQENITLLLEFLETVDFYSRLYSLQLLAAILSARTERTEECVFTAPLGISRLVAVLDDQREAIRNEAVVLLTYLTPTSIEIQKLVAFENAFEKLFSIIEADGSLSEGGRTVEDCLILLANLLRGNVSNQTLFRESGCITRLSNMLSRVLQPQDDAPNIASWAESQKNRNVYAFLSIIRLFVTRGSAGTPSNQTAIWKHGLAYHVLQLAFSPGAQQQIKAEALTTCGDLIRQNAALQEGFAQLMVSAPRPTDDTTQVQRAQPSVYVIDALLDQILCSQDFGEFDTRLAACNCLEAYFAHHADVRLHFLGRAIEGHQSGRNESANVLTVLLQSPAEGSPADPYRYWFAAVITFHLVYENPAAKAKAMSLTEGDASNGEEVVTSIQTVAAHVISGLRRGDDARVIVGYLMLLLGWLFEDPDAVNDFLAEGSNVQSLIQAVSQQPSVGGELVQGLCAMLLGVVYEFSTKDSPVPRATLHSILLGRLDRGQFLDRLTKLRSHTFLRDFEVTPQKLDVSSGRLPDVYFDSVFVEFFKDNYSRLARAIDRDPGMEISVVTNGIQKGISRELVDSLRSQLDEKDGALQEAQGAVELSKSHLNREKADHQHTRDAAAAEAAKLKSVLEDAQKSNEEKLRKLHTQMAAIDTEHRKQIAQLQKQQHDQQAAREDNHKKELAQARKEQATRNNDHEKQIAQARKTAEVELERLQRRSEAEAADLRATISRLDVDLMKAQKSKSQELHDLREKSEAELSRQKSLLKEANDQIHTLEKQKESEVSEGNSHIQKAQEQVDRLTKQLEEAHAIKGDLDTKVKKLQSDVAETNKTRESVQSELDDLLIVFGDLEEKVAKYKARLLELGEAVSEGEDEDDEEDDDDEDSDEED